MAQAMPPQGAVMTAAPEVPYALMNRMKLLSSAVLVASVISMLGGGFGILTIGAVVTSLLAYRSVTRAPNVKHLKWFSCWTFMCALLAIAGMIAAMAIGVPAVSCACDDECVDASWQLFDQIRTEANLSTTSSLGLSAATQQSYEQWAGKTYNATVASATALTDRISEQLHSLDSSEPGRMPPPPAQPPVVAELEEPAPPAGPRPSIRKPKEPGAGADIVPASPPQRARFMSAGDVEDEAVKPADTESAKPPSTVDEQGNPLPEFQHRHPHDHHHGGMRGSHHVCKKAAALRWMAPRLSTLMRRVAGHMQAMRAAHIMAAAREFEMMHSGIQEQEPEQEQEGMPVGTAIVFASPADGPELDGAAAPEAVDMPMPMHHPLALGRPGPLSLIRGFMHALMAPSPHEHERHPMLGSRQEAREHRDGKHEKQQGGEQDEEPQAVWRVHRLPGMRRLLLEDEAGASKHREQQQKQEGGKPPAVYFSSSSSSSSGKSSHYADNKRGKHHDGDKYSKDEEVSQSKLGAYQKQRLSDEQRERQEEIADEVLADAPNDQAPLVRLAAWGKTATRLDFDKLAAKVCGSGALVLTLGSILVSCFSVFLLVASSAAKKLSRHPYMVQQDALRRAARALAIQQRRGMGMGAIPMATPVAAPPSGGANGGAPSADAMYRFVPGAGFVQVNADGSPVANATPVPAAGATVPASFLAPHPSGGMLRHLGTGVASTLRTGAEMFGTLFRPGANRGGYAPVGTVESAADDTSSSGNQSMTATAPNGSSVEMTSFHHPGSNGNNGGNVATGGAVAYSSGGHAGAYAAYPQPMAPHAVPANHFQGQQHQQQQPMMMYGAPAAFIVQQPAPQGPPPGSAAAYTVAERR